MNKYQEAIAIRNAYIQTESGTKCLDDYYKESFDTLQELVNKETPKKPISKRLYYNCHNGECDKTFIYYCSVCNFDSVTKDYANYCPNCGQKLDWSDFE